MATEAMERRVKRRIEYMNLLHDNLDEDQLLKMYEHTVNKWKESLRTVPYSTEPEVFAPILAEIMASPLPSDLKEDLAQCIHSKTQTADPPLLVVDPGFGATPSAPDEFMVMRRSSTTNLISGIEFEIHNFFD